MRHVDQLKKEYGEEHDIVFKRMVYSEYIKHYMNKPYPFGLSESQAVSQWHTDLKDPRVRKSERRLWNPQSKHWEMFTLIHVETDDLDHRRESLVSLACSSKLSHAVLNLEPDFPQIYSRIAFGMSLIFFG